MIRSINIYHKIKHLFSYTIPEQGSQIVGQQASGTPVPAEDIPMEGQIPVNLHAEHGVSDNLQVIIFITCKTLNYEYGPGRIISSPF